MDLLKAIGELHAERRRLIKIIENLEALNRRPVGKTPQSRGRKYMNAAARQAVSQRMKRYWADRKGQDLAPEEIDTQPSNE